jgi:hypothetical protein
MEDILPKLGHERGKGSHAMFLMIKSEADAYPDF